MKVCACVLLFTILANVGKSAGDSPPLNDRAVHLALETVLEFNDKDKESDLKFLDKVKNLINKVQTVIDKSGSYRRDFKDGDIETLTDFIQQAVSILNSYDDATFGDFFKTLDDEVRKYHYRGCKFHELMENFEIRSLVGSAFDLIKNKPVQVIKAYMTVLADTLKDKSYDSNVKEIINYINSLYGPESKNKLTKVLQEIDNYGKGTSKKKHNTLARILREGIRSIIFDHYTELNPNARRELKAKIEMYLKKCKESPSNLTSNSVKSETILKKSLLHGVYKKETIKPSEKKLARIDINPRDFKKKSVEKLSGDEKKGIRHHRKEKKRQLKFPAVPVPTVKPVKEDKDLRAQSEDKELSSLSSSSEDDDEATDETVERNSIDISPERKNAYKTMRYITLYPEAITNVPRNNDKDTNVVHRSGRATTPRQHRFLTMWVEESTGGIPQYILNKYKATTLKPRKRKHKEAHTKKEKKHKKKHTKTKDKHHNKDESRESTKKKHGQKYKTHHNTRYTQKYVTKYTTTFKPSREYHYTSKKHKSKLSYEKLKHSNSKKINKLQEIKEVPPGLSTKKINNIFGPVRLDVNRNLLLNKITVRTTSAPSRRPLILRTTPSSLKSVVEKNTDEIQKFNTSISPSNSTITPGVGLSIPASKSLIAERFNILNTPVKWDTRKNAEHHPLSDGGLSIENLDKKQQASSSKEDPMKRLHRLEKELKEVKHRINTATKRTKKRELGKRSKENTERAEKHRENDPDSYDIRSVEHDRRKHHKTTELTTTRNNIRNEQPKHTSTVKKPEYQIEYKIVKEKGSGFKEIIANHRSKVSDKIIPIDIHGKVVKTRSDERQAKSHNNTMLIELSTKLFPIMTTKKSTSPVKTTEVDTTMATHFTDKALRDVTTTNNSKTSKKHHDHTKTTTAASTTSIATVNTETTIVHDKFKSIDIVPSDFTVPAKHVPADLNAKVTTKTVKQQTTENRRKDAIVMLKGLIEKSGKSVAQNEV
ncbi:unnamed protein product [Spodoptera littoralis]|uniref:Uncharacterized protein n=1 Tax=Spodoptera littoralis TaxID=7109 RepID=A0A9P0ICA0_SPOLI|nr:unnamed protein product [Spodoptera littoralis]CAH1642615.1 unnamed protein product [Spodoptera littoralis]